MVDIFYYYVVTLGFTAFLVALYGFYTRILHNKLVDSEKRLRLKLNEATSYFKGSSEKVPDFMQNALGNIGIEGILSELGIDPGMIPALLKNPFVKGLFDKYAPKILEQITKGGKIAGKGENSEIELL